ncbi:PAS domain S-box protein [Sediminitomix flava]|uniref:histidine kinase n=1 Tax=Sediminitomix flava TaxID=379075 RepID=A0A315Z1N9_SEDFL|nr:PAS domain S-box protein [Sediminitomix flava]PWJ36040.1 PAS domain S-box-containing protein [Sediminitomix flava]
MLREKLLPKLSELLQIISIYTIQGRILIFTFFFGLVLAFFTSVVIYQNKIVKSVGAHTLTVINPVTEHTTTILSSIHEVSASQWAYFITQNTKFKDERIQKWDLIINPAFEKLVKLSKTLSDEDKRSIDALGVLLKEYKHAQDEQEIYFDKFNSEREIILDNSGMKEADPFDSFIDNSMETPSQQLTQYTKDNLLNLIQPIIKELEVLLTPLVDEQKVALQKDVQMIQNNVEKLNTTIGFIAGFFVLMSLGSAVFVIRSFRFSILRSSLQLNHLVKGELGKKVETSKDETNHILDASNKLQQNLRKASEFAIQIGEGDFNSTFTPSSEQDVLGNALLQMRNQLKKVADEDEKRNWISRGIAQFVEILRTHSDVDVLADDIITNLVKYIGANQGGIFILNNDNPKERFLELEACYAYGRKRAISKQIAIDDQFAEGLIGQSFLEGDIIYMNNIPDNYIQISSGLGGAKPRCLLIVPLQINKEIEGVIELASFQEFDSHQIEFVERLGESIGATLKTAKNSQKNKLLLIETQTQGEQLRAQEEELRQNMEELTATQEEMQRRQRELERTRKSLEDQIYKQNVNLKYAQDRFSIVLKNLNEGIFDIDLRAHEGDLAPTTKVNWSPKFYQLLELRESELQPHWESFTERIHSQDLVKFNERVHQHLMDFSGYISLEIEIRIKNKLGEYDWYLLKGNTLRNTDGKPIHFAAAINNVSHQKTLETQTATLSEREGRLSAFLNNTTDHIVAIDKEYKIIVANEIVKETYAQQNLKIIEGETFIWTIIADEEKNKYQDYFERAFKGEQFTISDSYETVERHKIHLDVFYSPIYGNDPVPIGISVVTRDVSDIVNSKLKLAKENDALRAILDNYDASIYLKDRQGKYLFADKTFCYETGMIETDLIGKSDQDIKLDLYASNVNIDKEILKEEKPISFEMETEDHRIKHFSKYPIFDNVGRAYGLCSVAVDITNRKQIEKRLTESEERFLELGVHLPVILFQYEMKDEVGNCTYISDHANVLLQQKPSKICNQNESIENLLPYISVHRYDNDSFQKNVIEAIKKDKYISWQGRIQVENLNNETHYVNVRIEASILQKTRKTIWHGFIVKEEKSKGNGIVLEKKKDALIPFWANDQKQVEWFNQVGLILQNMEGAIFLYKHGDSWSLEKVVGNSIFLTGYSNSEFEKRKVEYFELISNFKQKLEEKRNALLNLSKGQKDQYTTTYRMIDKFGKAKLILEKGRIIYGKDMEISHLECLLVDISSMSGDRQN